MLLPVGGAAAPPVATSRQIQEHRNSGARSGWCPSFGFGFAIGRDAKSSRAWRTGDRDPATWTSRAHERSSVGERLRYRRPSAVVPTRSPGDRFLGCAQHRYTRRMAKCRGVPFRTIGLPASRLTRVSVRRGPRARHQHYARQVTPTIQFAAGYSHGFRGLQAVKVLARSRDHNPRVENEAFGDLLPTPHRSTISE